jgi:hypothetical protein
MAVDPKEIRVGDTIHVESTVDARMGDGVYVNIKHNRGHRDHGITYVPFDLIVAHFPKPRPFEAGDEVTVSSTQSNSKVWTIKTINEVLLNKGTVSLALLVRQDDWHVTEIGNLTLYIPYGTKPSKI